jgi:hypothetical protein
LNIVSLAATGVLSYSIECTPIAPEPSGAVRAAADAVGAVAMAHDTNIDSRKRPRTRHQAGAPWTPMMTPSAPGQQERSTIVSTRMDGRRAAQR